MTTCATCKHWGNPYNCDDERAMPVKAGMRLCNASVVTGDITPTHLFVATCIPEGIDGELFTRAEFGCRAWEGKP